MPRLVPAPGRPIWLLAWHRPTVPAAVAAFMRRPGRLRAPEALIWLLRQRRRVLVGLVAEHLGEQCVDPPLDLAHDG